MRDRFRPGGQAPAAGHSSAHRGVALEHAGQARRDGRRREQRQPQDDPARRLPGRRAGQRRAAEAPRVPPDRPAEDADVPPSSRTTPPTVAIRCRRASTRAAIARSGTPTGRMYRPCQISPSRSALDTWTTTGTATTKDDGQHERPANPAATAQTTSDSHSAPDRHRSRPNTRGEQDQQKPDQHGSERRSGAGVHQHRRDRRPGEQRRPGTVGAGVQHEPQQHAPECEPGRDLQSAGVHHAREEEHGRVTPSRPAPMNAVG